MSETWNRLAGRTVQASTPGGVACHFRVQYLDDLGMEWRLFAAYGQLQQARKSLVLLQRNGYSVRIIRYNICPAAA